MKTEISKKGIVTIKCSELELRIIETALRSEVFFSDQDKLDARSNFIKNVMLQSIAIGYQEREAILK